MKTLPFLFMILLFPTAFVGSQGQNAISTFKWEKAQSNDLWVTHATTKIFQDQSGTLSTPPQVGQSVTISLAKGGFGAFQVVLSPSQDLTGVTVSTSSFSSGSDILADGSIKLFLEYYVDVREETLYESVNDYQLGLYPDALLPLTEPFSVNANKNQPIWVEILVPSDTPSGTYSGTIEFSGGFIGSVQVTLDVLDFVLPKDTQLYNPAYLDLWELEELTSTVEQADQMAEAYVNFFADRGIIASDTIDAMGVLPSNENGNWDFSDWKDSMDALFTLYSNHFETPVIRVPVNFGEVLGFEVADAATDNSFNTYSQFLKQFRDFIKSSGLTNFQWLVWIDDLDEPNSAEKAWLIAKYALLTHEASDDQVSFHYRIDGTIDWDSPMVQFDLETDTSSWEPLDDKFTAWAAPQEDIEWNPQYLSDANSRQAKVTIYQQAWTALKYPQDEEEYPPDVPKKDYEFPSVPGIVNPALFSRVLPWVVYKYRLAGVNFWAAMAWYNSKTDQLIDPFVDNPALRIRGDVVSQNGDGFLVYPGTLVDEHSSQKDTDLPIPSLRLELFRLGLEDYKYIKLLDETIPNLTDQQNGQTLLDDIKNLITSVTQFERDPTKYDQAIDSIKEFLNSNKADLPSKLKSLNWEFDWQPGSLNNEEVPDEGIPLAYLPFISTLIAIPVIRRKRRT